MWMVSANYGEGLSDLVDFNGEHTWEARLVMCQLMFKTNFMVSDVYEAWALFQFAWLTLRVIGAHRKKKASRTVSSASLEDTSQKGIESLTVLGIYLFITGCLLESVYYLFTSSVEFYGGPSALQ